MASNINKNLTTSLKKILNKLMFGSHNVGIHYAQCAEDMQVSSILYNYFSYSPGFYIDVGSYHPYIGSNTYSLYRSGWKGINIDPRPGSKKLFDKERVRDINLEVGIGSGSGMLNYYYISEESALNSFSKQALIDNGVLDKVTSIIERPVVTLASVIQDHLTADQSIDFLNVDAEGFEMEVLTSVNWDDQRPKIIAIEQNYVNTLADLIKSDTCIFLENKQYQCIGKSVVTRSVSTVFYIDATQVSLKLSTTGK